MSTIYSIYKATNLFNGKIYIGFTCNFYKRKYEHLRSSDKGDYNTPFHNALRKYGKENFRWEVICQSKDGKYLLDVMEPFFIKENQSFGESGYNLTNGGEGFVGYKSARKGKPLSKSHKLSISLGKKGKSFSSKHKENLSKGQIKRNLKGSRNPFYGKTISDKNKKIISETNTKRLKGNTITKGRIWITNGIISKMIYPNSPLPSGWDFGRKFSTKDKSQ